ncbi:MAG TPA: hypothetical protein VK436_00825 [Methanocella sp.]|nr:hypothetical protein [Methanocella sp.]
MPVVDGKYETCLSTYFKSTDNGVDEIKRKLGKARKVRISNVPRSLVDELRPLLSGKDVKIVLAEGEKPDAGLRSLGDVAVTKARITADYKGVEAYEGSVTFADRVFNVIWTAEGVKEITSMNYRKCALCLNETFETAWHYADKSADR